MARKSRRQPAAPSASVLALRLLGRWTRIAQGHVALATGCSCGVGVSSLRVRDFEAQILEYLLGKHGARAQAGSVADLLRASATPANGQGRETLALLADLERTIDSFEQQHG